MRPLLLLAAAMTLIACSGPTEEDVANRESDRACGKLYSSQTKVWQDILYSKGVAELKFAKKDDYVAKCSAMKLTDEQMDCLDPNLADESCKDVIEAIKDQKKELDELLLGDMMPKKEGEGAGDKAEDGKEGEGEGEGAGAAEEGEGKEG